MPAPGEAALVAALLTGPDLARAAVAAWGAGEALLPMNPRAPATETRRLLDGLRPTHLLDADGRRRYPGGLPVPSGTAAVVSTSGTTEVSRGVELTAAGLDAMARGYSESLGTGPEDRWLACLPLHHVAGLAIVGRAFVTGVNFTVHDAFDLERVARAPDHEGATIVSVVPTTLGRLLDVAAPLHRYRKVIVGGAPCPPRLRDRAHATGVALVSSYGLSETWGGVALDGTPLQDSQVRISADGEILVRGPMVMRGYRLQPGATAAVLDGDGWLHTGDAGAWEGGVLTVLDRRKDLVITGGVSVAPTEVEEVLAAHPAVADACVVGAPDDEWGERVVACVVPADPAAPPTLDALRSFARERLSPEKLPREVRLVESIPRNAAGKPLRRLLRDPSPT